MQSVRDTFLHYVADNLPSYTVKPIRKNANGVSDEYLQIDAVNITFRTLRPSVHVGRQAVTIDIVFDDERQLIACLSALWVILSSSFYTPLFDYTVPASPVAQGSNVMWDRDSISFSRIEAPNFRYSATFDLRFHT